MKIEAIELYQYDLTYVAGYQPRVTAGRGAAPTGPGLGIEVDRAMLGAPVASFGRGAE